MRVAVCEEVDNVTVVEGETVYESILGFWSSCFITVTVVVSVEVLPAASLTVNVTTLV